MIKPLLSIIVCTYNRAEDLLACLESLTNQDIDREFYEIIVVNNNSTDGTIDKATLFSEYYKNIRVVTEKKQGLSYSRNRGWLEAQGKYVAYLDDDARATPGWCGRIITAFVSVQPSPVAVGGTIMPLYDTPPPAWFTNEFEIRSWGEFARFLDPVSESGGFSGSNMAFLKDLLVRYGGFLTTLGMHGNKLRVGEETEFFQRVSKCGGLFWYDPNISVYHLAPSRNWSLSYRFIRSYRVGESAIYMQERRLLSAKYVREFMCLFKLIFSVPYRLFVAKGLVKTEICRLFQEFGYKCGYLFGGKFS